jgi:hypothetical protein
MHRFYAESCLAQMLLNLISYQHGPMVPTRAAGKSAYDVVSSTSISRMMEVGDRSALTASQNRRMASDARADNSSRERPVTKIVGSSGTYALKPAASPSITSEYVRVNVQIP